MMDIAEFAKPLAGEKPAGENMEYNQAYLELEALASDQGATEGEGPDWKLLAKSCRALWEKTRDLRVAVYLTIAETALGGVKELAAGLNIINFLIKEMWDTVYPLLDSDDDNDPTERINIFTMLSPEAGAMNDPVMFINRLRETKIMPPLPYTIRDLLIAQGEIEPLDGKTVDLNLIIGELMGIPLPQVTEQANYAKTARETIESICGEANGKITGGDTLSLAALAKELDKLIRFFSNYFAAVGETVEKDSVKEDSQEKTSAGEAAAGETPGIVGDKRTAPGLAAAGVSVNIANYKPVTRTDALLLLKKVIEYYQSLEPGSPIPFLLSRALRMAQMNFLELLENIAPEAVVRGRDILGWDTETPGPQIRAAPSRSVPSPVSAQESPPLPAASALEPPRIPRIARVPKTQ
ncbi:MAG: type VI secretion system ImpA family N-terminal domain-containing protein [Spirochaetaceae bacterium]|jgi:type VI secretion system protein ImpA|nr:type VI secretion system ImpA family N-terminal domain-containing protein [Spirochaetaceae bacterium]